LHFKGNFPESFSLEACDVTDAQAAQELAVSGNWKELISRTKLQADARHFFEKELQTARAATHVRFNIYPDGGVSRLRLFGTITT